ncbi:MAG TPA: ABC transporter ATP-binding protein [Chloroflexota bacterium]|nr:ABC transporter ATP-binding protein [Chloroflexota bacterium]
MNVLQVPASLSVPTRSRYLGLLATYVAPQWPRALLLFMLLAGKVALDLLLPQLLRHFVDGALTGRVLESLTLLAALYTGAALLRHVVRAGAGYAGEDLAWTATNRLRLDLAAHCLHLDLTFHKRHSPGELIERVDGDVELLSRFFSHAVAGGLTGAGMLVGVLALLFAQDWRLGLSFTGFAVLAMLALFVVRRLTVPYVAADRAAGAGFYGWLGEVLTATEDLRSAGAEPHVMRELYARLRAWLPVRLRADLGTWSLGATTAVMLGLAMTAGLAICAYLWREGALTVGTAFAVLRYGQLLGGPIEALRTQVEDMQKAGASLARIEALLHTPRRLAWGADRLPASVPLAVAFERVSFAYPAPGGEARVPVLQDVSFSVAPGRVLGVVGRTGSGKTTLARLLARQFDPLAGRIVVGGVPLPSVHLSSLRAAVGLVTQDVQLFHATVRENLTCFSPAYSQAQLLATLEALGLEEWLRLLPQGLETILTPSRLSAGEAQLLAIGRLLLRDPGLVILDEASSRLDPCTERRLERAIDRVLGGGPLGRGAPPSARTGMAGQQLQPPARARTGIVIAHRLATLDRADDVLILEEGRVCEYGPRQALASDPTSRFAGLLKTGLGALDDAQ